METLWCMVSVGIMTVVCGTLGMQAGMVVALVVCHLSCGSLVLGRCKTPQDPYQRAQMLPTRVDMTMLKDI